MAFPNATDEQLFDLLYEAAGDARLWTEFLAAVARRLDGRLTALISHTPTSGKYPLIVSVGADPEQQRLYGEYYGAQDPWVLAGEEKLVEGWVGRGSSLCPPSELVRTEFYNDFYRFWPHFYPLAAIIERHGVDRSFLTIMRDRSQSDFSDSDVKFVRNLYPHLKRALKLHRRMLDLKQSSRATGSVLDGLDIAIVGLDDSGRVLFTNRLAELMFLSGGVLSLRDGRIVARDPRENAALARLLKSALAPGSNAASGNAVTIHDADRSLYVCAFPYKSADNVFPTRQRVLMVINDPGAAPKTREGQLTSLFRLTAAENRVIELLLSGLEPKEIAARTRTTENTVRSHLKSIYGKTGMTRQSHLIRLVSKLPGRV